MKSNAKKLDVLENIYIKFETEYGRHRKLEESSNCDQIIENNMCSKKRKREVRNTV